MARRASPTSAHFLLLYARDAGHIGGFKRLPGGRWLIQVPATRYAACNGDTWGEIVLSTREVLAFAEGLWSGLGINPTHRAGAEPGSAIRDFDSRHGIPRD